MLSTIVVNIDYKQIVSQNMKLVEGLKAIVYKCDLLCSKTLLRVKGEPQFQTLLGGIISISIMIMLAAVFYNKIIDTFDKVIITTSASITNQNDPTSFHLKTLDLGTFMFGVEVWHHDLNTGNRYFDITLTNTVYYYGQPSDNASVSYPLEPCRKDHWDGFPEIQANYERLNMSYWKCLPKNVSYQIKGKYASPQSKTLDVAVKKCTNNTFDDRPCASEEEINQFLIDNAPLFFTIYFINPLINPDSQTYLTYYLEDKHYIAFSAYGGQEARLFVQDYQIETDQSIFPFTDIITETGGIISNSPLKSTYTQATDTYALFYFYKSPISTNYSRSFQKVDSVLSYIGGLFGTIMIVFFLVSAYNTYKFQINISGYLFATKQKELKMERNYNFVYFLGQLIFGFLKKFSLRPNWQKLKYFYETREEALKQLDILFLLKRLNFLERSLSLLFTDSQLKGLYLASHTTLGQAVSFRRNYRLKPRLKEQIKQVRKKQSSEKQSIEQRDQFDSNISSEVMKDHKAISNNSSNEQISHSDKFDSDCYSSDSSQEEGEEKILDSVIQLKKQSGRNPISRKIWTNLDSRLKYMLSPIRPLPEDEEQQSAQGKVQEQKIANLDVPNPNLLLFLDPNIEDINEESQHQINYVFAKETFEKLRGLNTKSSIQIVPNQK